jgi:ABC-type Fe3+-hydroxamate transport system substrate-binding protein
MRFFILLLTTIFFVGCSSTDTSNTATNTKTANTNAANTAAITNVDNPLATTKTPEVSTTNDAPTLAPIVQSYYAALGKKDEAGAKKFLSQSAQKYWEDEAKTEKKPLFAYLLESEDPVNAKREVRNEKIEADSAVAELKGGSLGVWTKVKFVKENGEWKFASPKESLALQDIPTSNSKTAK